MIAQPEIAGFVSTGESGIAFGVEPDVAKGGFILLKGRNAVIKVAAMMGGVQDHKGVKAFFRDVMISSGRYGAGIHIAGVRNDQSEAVLGVRSFAALGRPASQLADDGVTKTGIELSGMSGFADHRINPPDSALAFLV